MLGRLQPAFRTGRAAKLTDTLSVLPRGLSVGRSCSGRARGRGRPAQSTFFQSFVQLWQKSWEKVGLRSEV